MRLGRLVRVPVQRVALAVLVMAVVVTGIFAARMGAAACSGSKQRCAAVGKVRWSRPLGGSWIAEDGVEGTVYGRGQAAVGAGHGVAVIGYGLKVSAFDVANGFPRWSESLTGLPGGSVIVSVRTWQDAVTVGVSMPRTGASATVVTGSSAAGTATGASSAGSTRREVVLNPVTGKQVRSYPAAPSGGAVHAGSRQTVIVGPSSVVSYLNTTGRQVWRHPIGAAAQTWRVAGRKLYVTVSAGGEIGTAPVTAVRQIDLQTGAERLIKPRGNAFRGMLTAVIGGELVFSGNSGLSLYSIASGRLTGQRAGAIAEGADPVQRVLYANVAGALRGIDPVTGLNEPGTASAPAGVFGVRAGVALGLDTGNNGAVWGYSLAKRHVIWTAKALPWPHYFAEASGLGGSIDPETGTVLLVTCAGTGDPVQATVVGGGGRACLRPRLVAIGPWGAAP